MTQRIDSFHGRITLETAQTCYTPGEKVCGAIQLALANPIKACELVLTVKCQEKTKFYELDDQSSGWSVESQVVEVSEAKESFRQEFAIEPPTLDGWPAGRFSYPFCFVLPDSLGPSFEYTFNEYGRECFARIKYSVKARLRDETSGMTLRGAAVLEVGQPSWTQATTPVIKEFQGTIRDWCVLSKGQLSVQGYCDKETYELGTQARVVLETDCSQLRTDVQRINCRLLQRVILRAQGRLKEVITATSCVQLPGVARGCASIFEKSVSGHLAVESRGPCQPSVIGHLLSCHYTLEADVLVAVAAFCRPDIKLTFPISVKNAPKNPRDFDSVSPNLSQTKVMPMIVCPLAPIPPSSQESPQDFSFLAHSQHLSPESRPLIKNR